MFRRLGRLGLRLRGRRAGALAVRFDAPGQGAELHLFKEGRQHRRIGLGHRQLVDRGRQRGVAIEPHQLARQPDLVGEGDQGLAALLLLHLAGPGQQGVEVAVLQDQRRSRLDADARRARHVVDAVAAQGLDVDHLVRRHAELLDHLVVADADILHGVEHGDPRADQLHQVLVGGDDHHLAAHVADLAGVGGDQVVGLVARLLQAGHAEGPGRLAHQRELRDQVFRRRRPVGLVLGVELVAEGLLRMVEYHRQMGRRVVLRLHVDQQLPQHVAETGHRPDRQAVGLARQRRQGVEGPEDEARAVHQIEADARPVLGRLARDLVQGLRGGFEGVAHAGEDRRAGARRHPRRALSFRSPPHPARGASAASAP
jgi:hypothetical protein